MAAVLVCAAVTVYYYYHRVNEEVRRHVQATLAQQYPNFLVSLGSARVIKGEGIRLREFSIVRPADVGLQRSELAYADEIFLQCDASLPRLAQGQVDVRHVRVRGLLVRPTLEADGSWNIAELLSLPKPQTHAPTVSIEEATVEVLDRRNSPPSVFAVDNVRLTLTPASTGSAAADQQGETHGTVRLQGSLSSDHFRRADVNGCA